MFEATAAPLLKFFVVMVCIANIPLIRMSKMTGMFYGAIEYSPRRFQFCISIL
jgi:hypothetical protein